jgi:hypothetical protein
LQQKLTKAVKFNLFFNSLYSFILFLPLRTFENEKSAIGFET